MDKNLTKSRKVDPHKINNYTILNTGLTLTQHLIPYNWPAFLVASWIHILIQIRN